jgi:hypothetical protein
LSLEKNTRHHRAQTACLGNHQQSACQAKNERHDERRSRDSGLSQQAWIDVHTWIFAEASVHVNVFNQ